MWWTARWTANRPDVIEVAATSGATRVEVLAVAATDNMDVTEAARGVAKANGGECGGVLTLLALIEEHEPAFAYDWRTRFHQTLHAIEHGAMSWREAWLPTNQLLTDPSSRVLAAVAGWQYPLTREALRLLSQVRVVLAARGHR